MPQLCNARARAGPDTAAARHDAATLPASAPPHTQRVAAQTLHDPGAGFAGRRPAILGVAALLATLHTPIRSNASASVTSTPPGLASAPSGQAGERSRLVTGGGAPQGLTLPQARAATGQALQQLRAAKSSVLECLSCLAVDSPSLCIEEARIPTVLGSLASGAQQLRESLPVLGAEIALHPSWGPQQRQGKSASMMLNPSLMALQWLEAAEAQLKGDSLSPADLEWYDEVESMTDGCVDAAVELATVSLTLLEQGKEGWTVAALGRLNDLGARALSRADNLLLLMRY